MASEQSEPKRCECYRCSGRGWKTVLVDAGPAQKVTCKLCGGDGEIEAPECRCGWCHWSGVFWLARGGTPVSHCPDKCGCRLSVVDGEPRVGLSVRARVTELEAALKLERDALIELAYYLGADCEAPPPDGGPNYNTFADGWVLWARARVRREQRGVRRRAKAKQARKRAAIGRLER